MAREHQLQQNEAWNTFASLFSKKNNTRLQVLKNKLLSIAQCNIIINQYFIKVKSLYRKISELDPIATIVETRIKKIIIHSLRPEYRSFVTVVQGWPIQPSLIEFENFLTDQEAIAKQMSMVSLKGDEEALYINKRKGRFK